MSSANYKVGAAIVTYNSPLEALDKAVSSFCALDGIKLVIVDNGSSGYYRTQLKAMCTGRAEIIESPSNIGFGGGHNLAAKHFGSIDYFAVVNPDIVAPVGSIETMLQYMEEHNDVVLLAPKVLNEDGSLQPQNKRNPTVVDLFIRRFLPESWFKKRRDYYSMMDVGYDEICAPEFISGCFMLFRKNAFDKISGFDERFFLYFEDADITRRIREEGKAIYYPNAVIIHKWARGAHRSKKLMFVMISSAIKYFGKWGWKFW